MGNGKLKPAVVDAGPIIHLKEIGCLSYLQLFPTLHIPDAVWSETVGHGRVLKEELTRLDNIQHHTLNNLDVERFIKDNGCEDLDAVSSLFVTKAIVELAIEQLRMQVKA